MITNTVGKLLYVNPAWTEIYGYKTSEALGNTPRILHSGFQTPEFYKKMWETILDSKSGHWKGEVINKSKDGKLIPVLLTITPFRADDNQIIGHMGIALDISSQKKLEAEMLQQDRLASIGILASGLAHEVGTPLGVIRGRAEFLMMQNLQQEPDPSRAALTHNLNLKNGLQTIISQIDRISSLIHSLLRFSRPNENSKIELVKLHEVIYEVMNLLDQTLKKNQIELKLDVAQNQLVLADFNKLQQIFLNLLINAIQAIQQTKREHPENSCSHSILIKASSNEKRISNKGKSILISIRDTGCGIKSCY
jgi:PAS domain S-box-containing protein